MANIKRIIYASQSVIANGVFLYRVQTLGSTTTFNSTDLFELGQQDVIDVVDDVPTVAITLDTNDWGTVRTAATLASVSIDDFDVTANSSNATLATVSAPCTGALLKNSSTFLKSSDGSSLYSLKVALMVARSGEPNALNKV